MVSYGTGVTQGPRMLGGFLVQKYVIFMTKNTKQLTFHKKDCQGVCFPIKCEFILCKLCDFYDQKYLTVYFP